MGPDSGSTIGVIVVFVLFLAIIPLIFFFPFQRIFLRAGINKNLAFLAFVPFFGFLILLGIAAFKDWPHEPGGYR